VRELIVTADDVGLHRGITAGAITAHRRGIVTACSVCACGAALDDAVASLAGAPDLDVGAHLMLVEGRAILQHPRIPSLVRHDNRFRAGHRQFVVDYLAGRIRLRDVEAELEAQLDHLLSAGLRPRHVNSHQHVHMLPGVFDVVARLAARYAIPYVRLVRDRGGHAGPLRRIAVGALRLLATQVRSEGLATSDRTIGVMNAGHLTPQRLLSLVEHVGGTTELVAHPGVGNAAIASQYDWGYDWESEMAALCDPDVRASLEQRGIRLRGITGS
jgi:chitin disaccharide deacetylase